MIKILEMYITLLPAIFTGIMVMIWCKIPLLNILKKPMDNNKNWFDGKRLFGDNKTWKGFMGYIIFGGITTVIWGAVCSGNLFLQEHNYLYFCYQNTLIYNLLTGLAIGLAYALFELPNSFIKRRIGISEGKSTKGITKIIFIFIDQADSIFGCVLVIAIVYPMSLGFYFIYVLMGAMTHIVFNMLLYALRLRKNLF